MICNDVQVLFDDYIDGTITDTNVEVVNFHCQLCESCSAKLDKKRFLHDSLAVLPVPPASEGFEKRVINAAIIDAQTINSNKNKRYKYAAVAMILVMVLFLRLISGDLPIEQSSQLLAVSEEVRNIKVAIDSAQALDAVTMRVELSDNLELSGFGNKKQIYWTTDLREGVNVISLPIVGIAQGTGKITTRVLLDGREKVMQIQTQYKIPDSVLFEENVLLQG